MSVRTAVIPVAGLGTRFLPVTRTVPKALIPVFDRPQIHLAVEEAAKAGIERVVLVISPGQESVVAYFDEAPELEAAVAEKGDNKLLGLMTSIAKMAEIRFVYQKQPQGLGHAVLLAADEVGDETFAVFLPDDIIWSDEPTISGLIDLHEKYGTNVIAVKEVPDELVPNLGIIEPSGTTGSISQIVGMVEKPALADAPSNLAIIGRYVLTPDIFDALRKTRARKLGEIQLTDAIALSLNDRPAYAYQFPGVHFDVGTPLGLLKASVYAAMRNDNVSAEFKEWLTEMT